jgi:hypothetical protein
MTKAELNKFRKENKELLKENKRLLIELHNAYKRINNN